MICRITVLKTCFCSISYGLQNLSLYCVGTLLNALNLFLSSPISWDCLELILWGNRVLLISQASPMMDEVVLSNVREKQSFGKYFCGSRELKCCINNCDWLYIILGVPKTGRMHQIRVHLQWLGKQKSLTPLHTSFCFIYVCRSPYSERSPLQPSRWWG